MNRPSTDRGKSRLTALTLAALGVVYGDIGTSPLYAFKEAFTGAHPLAPTAYNVLAVLSMMFWAVTLIVSLKYVTVVLRFSNAGEGGILALLARALRLTRERPRLAWTTAMLGILGASLFYGDSVLTPAISVLSAVEGISIATPALAHWVVPISIAILVCLFAIQARGTGGVGGLFGPVTLVWFAVLAAAGAVSIARTPAVLQALDPRYALAFAFEWPLATFFVLGAVFLAITGGEALYADMGHFGPRPIRIAWFAIVFPSLMINYFGQGALVMRDPTALDHPFYMLVPPGLLMPLVLLATAATVIASQATISGAFSITQQATRLGYLPRIPTRHTSATERGQIYIPQVNWTMMVLVVLVVIGFRHSSAVAAAYGIAVSGTMLLTTALIGIVLWSLPMRFKALALAGLALVGAVELLFFVANSTKIPEGGWFPLVAGAAVFVMLTTWRRVEAILHAQQRRKSVPIEQFRVLMGEDVPRVPGTAVYLSPDPRYVPPALVHNLKHNRVLHERIFFVSIVDADLPRAIETERTEVEILVPGAVYSVRLHYGFMEAPDITQGLQLLRRHGLQIDPQETTFFLGKTTLAPPERRGPFTWRRDLYRFMQRNSPAPAEYFNLPPERVVELGTRVGI
jgi:KUP system potassium uptake protein